MKLTKASLKVLIKECIVEVIEEGIGTSQIGPTLKENTKKRKTRSREPAQIRSTALDSIKFDRKAKDAAKNLTSDPVMQSIFSDTVKTTLQEQIIGASAVPVPAGADAAQIAAAKSKPEDLFEGSSNWAELAFSENLPT
jgi:hypothetical protein